MLEQRVRFGLPAAAAATVDWGWCSRPDTDDTVGAGSLPDLPDIVAGQPTAQTAHCAAEQRPSSKITCLEP